jgi:integrase
MKTEADGLKALIVKLDGVKGEISEMEEAAHPPLAFVESWKAFEESPKRPDCGDRTLSGYKATFTRFSKWVAKWHPAVLTLRDVTAEHAEEYTQDLKGVSASTFNQHIGLLRLVWRVLADKVKAGGANPWAGITRRKLQTLANRKRALTAEQFNELHAKAAPDQDMADLFIVLAWTGQRLVDALKLRWEAVSFRGKVLTLYPQKTARRTGKAVHIPIFEPLMEVLNRRHAAMPHTTAAAYVFPALVEDYDRDAGSAIAKRIQAVFKLAGITTKEERTGIKRDVVLYGAHSFRHLFVTAAAAAGLPAAMIKAITGHASDAMAEHYQQFDAKLASEFAKRLTGQAPAALPAPASAAPAAEPIPAWTRERLAAMTAENWQAIRDELLSKAVESASSKGGNGEQGR